ncbi:hypothetical protein BCY91_15535 [Pelobium manganitolerans]|uniref:Uncharacterized protein n=1 Tax=Pelobium manganitolerans TaxID=1842495 RepID=A0A419S8G0_9SPHI|nr:hypothetical protein [Pelobium manganitolerans]RKD18217.1 hypothetical protein BCY91_15535 [Pelobium manganitolerans]
METPITNMQQLQARITLLQLKKVEDEVYFNQKFTAIKEKILAPVNFVKGLFAHKSLQGHADWATRFGRIFVPMLLNRTILRKQGVVIKAVASLLSQKLVKPSLFNTEVLASWVDKATSFIKRKTKKERRYGADDYGIPPESETA